MSGELVVRACSLERELEKNPEISREDLRKLREWLRTQPHLPTDHITDQDLVLIYHCCERSSAVTKEVADLHFTLRTLFHSFFKARDVDSRIEKTLHVCMGLLLQERAVDGSALYYCRLLDSDVKNFVFSDCLRLVLMVLDLCQYEEGTWPGLMIAIDMDQVTLGHLARLDVQSIQQFLYYLQEAMLVKLKAVHFLNAPSFMDKLMMMLKPFMKKKLLDMIHIHQRDADTLDKFIDRKAFPKEAGGEYKDLKTCRDETWAKMKANRQFFIDENNKRVVESKRPGKPKTITDIFGSVEGSFKKLDID